MGAGLRLRGAVLWGAAPCVRAWGSFGGMLNETRLDWRVLCFLRSRLPFFYRSIEIVSIE
ncbi:hypothetical protein GCM10025785_12360 [Corynebacterium canis]